MKLFHKVFLCFSVIFGLTFQVAGYLLIDFSYQNVIEQEKRIATQQFQYNQYILQSALYAKQDSLALGEQDMERISRNFSVPVAFYGADRKLIFDSLSTEQTGFDFENKANDTLSYRIVQSGEESYIYVYGYVSQGENEAFLVTETDISQAISSQREMADYFQKIYLVLLGIGIPFLILVTGTLTGSIKKVSKAANKIAEGNYSERIVHHSKDEVGELACDFNRMAEKVEEKIFELLEMARQKEDFTANFAHELKTPLTSVIGYADMLYQKDLPRQQVKEVAGYILSEGMRLEALSQKLMDLFVLDKQRFMLEQLQIREMLEHMKPGMVSLCEKNGVSLSVQTEEACVRADYDLFETMILNLIDNAVKADSCNVNIIGKRCKTGYELCVADDGKGIPPQEIERITEAFYMVDKSRSRKLHGAGLGMALVSKIVNIHGMEMKIVSDGKSGTQISLLFPKVKGVQND